MFNGEFFTDFLILIKSIILTFVFLILFLAIFGSMIANWADKWVERVKKDVEDKSMAEWLEDR